jgi:hypothetical protein
MKDIYGRKQSFGQYLIWGVCGKPQTTKQKVVFGIVVALELANLVYQVRQAKKLMR